MVSWLQYTILCLEHDQINLLLINYIYIYNSVVLICILYIYINPDRQMMFEQYLRNSLPHHVVQVRIQRRQ